MSGRRTTPARDRAVARRHGHDPAGSVAAWMRADRERRTIERWARTLRSTSAGHSRRSGCRVRSPTPRGGPRGSNAAAKRLFGDVTGKPFTSVVAPEHAAFVQRQLRRKLRGVPATDYEVDVKRRTGRGGAWRSARCDPGRRPVSRRVRDRAHGPRRAHRRRRRQPHTAATPGPAAARGRRVDPEIAARLQLSPTPCETTSATFCAPSACTPGSRPRLRSRARAPGVRRGVAVNLNRVLQVVKRCTYRSR